MFGLKRMHQQRERLYLRTQMLENRAKTSREKAVNHLLDTATSPTGLVTSFLLGASTQFDVTKKVRKSLLNGASRDVVSFLITQASVYMNSAQTTKVEEASDHCEEGCTMNEGNTVASTTQFAASEGHKVG